VALLAERGEMVPAAFYILSSVLIAIFALFAGLWLGRIIG
jgi:fluoride ion exporter CrcB/FEX